jgi:glycopeptide antibiotics resistance protein
VLERRRWWILWLAWFTVIVALTTMPWSNFVGHSHWQLVRWIPFYDDPEISDMLANMVLFLPFGVFLGKALPQSSSRRVRSVVILSALALSTSVEIFQVYCHNRTPSTTDICTDVLGAVFGVMASKAL